VIRQVPLCPLWLLIAYATEPAASPRNGYLPQRTIQTRLSDIEVKVTQVRDRAKQIKFSSAILPPYLRRTKTIEELLPWLYLKGVSSGGFQRSVDGVVGA
jgi:transposase-like protein